MADHSATASGNSSVNQAICETFDVIAVLLRPGCLENSDKDVSKKTMVDASLVSSVEALHHAVENEQKYKEMKIYLGPKIQTLKQEVSSATDVRWVFIEHCLVLLQSLTECLQKAMNDYHKSKEKSSKQIMSPNCAPQASPDTLSFTQQKSLTALFQFIISLGVCPCLVKGVGIPLSLRSGFGAMLQYEKPLPFKERQRRLLRVLRVFMFCMDQPVLGGIMLSKHLNDVLAMLIQLSCTPDIQRTIRIRKPDGTIVNPVVNPTHKGGTSSSAERQEGSALSSISQEVIASVDITYCHQKLETLVDRCYQPSVIKELLMLQGGPGAARGTPQASGAASSPRNPLPRAPLWLTKVCSRLLAERLMKPGGVANFLKGVLDVGASQGDSTIDWRKCDAVATLLATCPSKCFSSEVYYEKICPQLLDLLHSEDELLMRQILRVACTCIVAMVTMEPLLTRQHLLKCLMRPLLVTTSVEEFAGTLHSDANNCELVSEAELSQCIVDLHKVFVIGREPSSHLMPSLVPVLHPLFHLYCFAKEGVCNLRNPVEEILYTYLRTCDQSAALKSSEHAIGIKHHPALGVIDERVTFAPGSGGGAIVMYTPNISSDELFTQALLSHEHVGTCCAYLLKKVSLETLSAEFFISVLNEMTTIVSLLDGGTPTPEQQSKASSKSAGTSSDLLRLESMQKEEISQVQHALRVLAVLSQMCESLGPEVVKSTGHMLQFAHTALQRCCHRLENNNPDEDVPGLLETETLSMAIGLLSAIITDQPWKNLQPDDKEALGNILPLLKTVVRLHPLEPIQKLANDLAISVATHGAVSSSSGATKADIAKETRSKDLQDNSNRTIAADNERKLFRSNNVKPVEEVPTSSSAVANDVEGLVGEMTDDFHKQSIDSKMHGGDHNAGEKKSVSVPDTSLESETGTRNNDQSAFSEDMISSKEFDEAFQDLFDPLIPVRGHALIALSKLVRAKDPKALDKSATLLTVFEENLAHDDTYIYLAAINGLVALTDVFPDRVVPHVCDAYACCHGDSTSQSPSANKKQRDWSVETRLKLGEALVKTTRQLGEMVPHYRTLLLNSILSGTKDPDGMVRASSLSNLGEVCQLLRFSLGSIIHEVMACVTSLIKTDPNLEVKRSGIKVMTLLLKGVGKDAMQVLGDTLPDIYRCLKLVVSTDRDDVLRLHAQLALEELSIIMKDYLFPEQTLSKKITVLS